MDGSRGESGICAACRQESIRHTRQPLSWLTLQEMKEFTSSTVFLKSRACIMCTLQCDNHHDIHKQHYNQRQAHATTPKFTTQPQPQRQTAKTIRTNMTACWTVVVVVVVVVVAAVAVVGDLLVPAFVLVLVVVLGAVVMVGVGLMDVVSGVVWLELC